MITRNFGTPLLGIGLLATLAACGKEEPEPETPVEQPEDTAEDPDPNRPASMMWRGVFGWDNTAGEIVSFTENATEVAPRIEITLVSQYVDPATTSPTANDICFVLVDISNATVSDWDDNGEFPLTLEVAAGAEVTYNCPDWDFASFGDPADVFSTPTWRIGLGAADLDADYYKLLNDGGFFTDTNPEDLYAGGYMEYVDGWVMDKSYARAYEVDDTFTLKIEDSKLVPIDKYSMPAATGVVNAVYVVDSHFFWRLN